MVDDVDYSSCKVGCEGLHADVEFINSTMNENSKGEDSLKTLIKAYEKYKESQIESFEIVYDDGASYKNRFQIAPKPYQPLRVIQIYFNTATYDEIVRDVSVTLADQLGVIGGTMGLFAGFSFLSGLEIIYFFVKYLISVVNRNVNM